MTAKTAFRIAYDGAALRDHAMDVRDLAPALLSFGQLLERANFLLNGDKASVRLNVRALSSGSFGIDLELAQSLYTQATQFLTGDFIVSALNLKELLVGGGVAVSSLWVLYKVLKGRKPDRVERVGDAHVRIILGDEQHVFPMELLKLYQDMAVRKAVEEVVRPLEREGIEEFVVRDESGVLVDTKKEECIYFASQPEKMEDVLLSDREYEGVFAIIAPVFKDDNKWRLSDGIATINVAIADKAFLERVDQRQESFFKGDLLKCAIRTRQWQTMDGLRTEHEVLHVVEHIQTGSQLKLFPSLDA